jgi:chromosome segregation ATPase
MKNKTLAITLLSIAAFAVGCNKEQTKEQTTSQQIENVKTETKQAAQDMKDYTFAQKAEFVAAMQGQLDALNKDIDQLAAKIDSSSDAVKAEAKPKLQALRDQAAPSPPGTASKPASRRPTTRRRTVSTRRASG